MNIEFTKDVPEEFPFKSVVIGEVFTFSVDKDVYIKIPELKDDIGSYVNAIELCSGDLGYFPSDCKVCPVRHRLLIYED